jgi:hypothetical protein
MLVTMRTSCFVVAAVSRAQRFFLKSGALLGMGVVVLLLRLDITYSTALLRLHYRAIQSDFKLASRGLHEGR